MFEAYLYTLLWSFVPALELRAAIPLGHLKFGLPLWEATVLSIIGSAGTAAILLWLLPIVVKFFDERIPFVHRIMLRIFEHTRRRVSHKMTIIGDIALVTFVAIPLPGSGAWTGSLIAFLFGVKYATAVGLISLGVAISGLIVAGLTMIGAGLWEALSATWT